MVRGSRAVEVRRDDHNQAVSTFECIAHKQHVPSRIRQDFNHELVVIARVGDRERGQVRSRRRQSVAPHALQINPLLLANQIKAKVANLR